MFVGRALYILGVLTVAFSLIVMVLGFFSQSGFNFLFILLALMNGLIAIGVGELVMDLNLRRNEELNPE